MFRANCIRRHGVIAFSIYDGIAHRKGRSGFFTAPKLGAVFIKENLLRVVWARVESHVDHRLVFHKARMKHVPLCVQVRDVEMIGALHRFIRLIRSGIKPLGRRGFARLGCWRCSKEHGADKCKNHQQTAEHQYDFEQGFHRLLFLDAKVCVIGFAVLAQEREHLVRPHAGEVHQHEVISVFDGFVGDRVACRKGKTFGFQIELLCQKGEAIQILPNFFRGFG